MINSRRELFRTAAFLTASAALSGAHAVVAVGPKAGAEAESPCALRLDGILAESNETPFFEHFHQLFVPIQTLIQPPEEGLLLKSSPVDAGSYDLEGFTRFVKSTGLNSKALSQHDHEVKITAEVLTRIARGEKDVEIRVISKNGNYVHNFLITASPAVLSTIRNATRR